MRLSQRYADHEAEISAMMAYIELDGAPTPAANRIGITQADITALLALKTTWDTAYTAYRAPATHNEITVAAMKRADSDMYATVLPFRHRLKHGAVELNAQDYAQLTIHKDKENANTAMKAGLVKQFFSNERSLDLGFIERLLWDEQWDGIDEERLKFAMRMADAYRHQKGGFPIPLVLLADEYEDPGGHLGARWVIYIPPTRNLIAPLFSEDDCPTMPSALITLWSADADDYQMAFRTIPEMHGASEIVALRWWLWGQVHSGKKAKLHNLDRTAFVYHDPNTGGIEGIELWHGGGISETPVEYYGADGRLVMRTTMQVATKYRYWYSGGKERHGMDLSRSQSTPHIIPGIDKYHIRRPIGYWAHEEWMTMYRREDNWSPQHSNEEGEYKFLAGQGHPFLIPQAWYGVSAKDAT